LSSGWKIH